MRSLASFKESSRGGSYKPEQPGNQLSLGDEQSWEAGGVGALKCATGIHP